MIGEHEPRKAILRASAIFTRAAPGVKRAADVVGFSAGGRRAAEVLERVAQARDPKVKQNAERLLAQLKAPPNEQACLSRSARRELLGGLTPPLASPKGVQGQASPPALRKAARLGKRK